MQIPRSLRELVMTTKSSAFVDESAATKNRNRADRECPPHTVKCGSLARCASS